MMDLNTAVALYFHMGFSYKERKRHIRRIFGRNVGILKRLKIFRRFKRIFECYSFNSILEYGKIGKI